uniref:VWFD domain-containing protein n=1 Tax=Spongospora subterranea TaxID=70186 RepID=A0A0H5RCV3_9EUKA|eukprot:CRZ11432.1 hypothetical protein [Spongospora subterranea]
MLVILLGLLSIMPFLGQASCVCSIAGDPHILGCDAKTSYAWQGVGLYSFFKTSDLELQCDLDYPRNETGGIIHKMFSYVSSCRLRYVSPAGCEFTMLTGGNDDQQTIYIGNSKMTLSNVKKFMAQQFPPSTGVSIDVDVPNAKTTCMIETSQGPITIDIAPYQVHVSARRAQSCSGMCGTCDGVTPAGYNLGDLTQIQAFASKYAADGSSAMQPIKLAPIPTTCLAQTPMPTNATTPMPTNGTTPMPTNGSTPMPTNGSTPMPINGMTPMPINGTTPMPNSSTTPMPTSGTTPMPTNGTIPATFAPSNAPNDATPVPMNGTSIVPLTNAARNETVSSTSSPTTAPATPVPGSVNMATSVPTTQPTTGPNATPSSQPATTIPVTTIPNGNVTMSSQQPNSTSMLTPAPSSNETHPQSWPTPAATPVVVPVDKIVLDHPIFESPSVLQAVIDQCLCGQPKARFYDDAVFGTFVENCIYDKAFPGAEKVALSNLNVFSLASLSNVVPSNSSSDVVDMNRCKQLILTPTVTKRPDQIPLDSGVSYIPTYTRQTPTADKAPFTQPRATQMGGTGEFAEACTDLPSTSIPIVQSPAPSTAPSMNNDVNSTLMAQAINAALVNASN